MLKDKVEWKDGRRKRAMKVGLAVRHFCAQASHYALFILGHLQARKSLTGNLHREIDPVLGLPAYVSSGLAGQIVFLAIHSYSQTPAYPISSCFANPHQSYQGALHISNLSSRTHVSHIKKLFTSAIFLHPSHSLKPPTALFTHFSLCLPTTVQQPETYMSTMLKNQVRRSWVVSF